MSFNVDAATARYIESAGSERLAQAARYTEGSHWLLLWGLLLSGLITWMVVRSGVLDRLQAKLQKRRLVTRALVVSATYIAISSVLTLPLSVYESWWRERAYGLSDQLLGDFLLETVISDLLGVAAGGSF